MPPIALPVGDTGRQTSSLSATAFGTELVAAINDFLCIRITLTTPRDPRPPPPAGKIARASAHQKPAHARLPNFLGHAISRSPQNNLGPGSPGVIH